MTMDAAERTTAFEQGTVRGFLHMPEGNPGFGMVLTHGAGTNCESPLLKAVASVFAESGFAVLRCDLPFRQRRRTGPPHPSVAAQDRTGLLEAATTVRDLAKAPVVLAGHSYGGRQASMLAAERPSCCRGLLLLSYPLHPPAKPEQLRTAHFGELHRPALFVHGSDDPFGTEDELRSALSAVPASTELSMIAKAGHDLLKGRFDLVKFVVDPLTRLLVPAASAKSSHEGSLSDRLESDV